MHRHFRMIMLNMASVDLLRREVTGTDSAEYDRETDYMQITYEERDRT